MKERYCVVNANNSILEDSNYFQFLRRIYIEGELERKSGYDLASANPELYSKIKKFKDDDNSTQQVIKAIFVYENGDEEDVNIYIWKSIRDFDLLGSIVLCEDKKGNSMSKKSLEMRVNNL